VSDSDRIRGDLRGGLGLRESSSRAGVVDRVAAGTLAVVVALVLLALVARLDLRSAFVQVIAAPFQQGSARTPTPGILSPVRMVVGTLRRLPGWAHLWSLNLAIGSIALVPFAAKRNPPGRFTCGRWPR
jgi:hypothetical protein